MVLVVVVGLFVVVILFVYLNNFILMLYCIFHFSTIYSFMNSVTHFLFCFFLHFHCRLSVANLTKVLFD